MTSMELVLSHSEEIKNVVFVIGDRDFYDLFKFFKKKKFNTYILGFRKNLSSHFFDLFSPNNIIYINDHWNEIVQRVEDNEFPPLVYNSHTFINQREINLGQFNNESKSYNQNVEK